MNILLTGGAGYIGSHTCVALVQAGFTPVIVDDFSNSHLAVLQRLQQITSQAIACERGDVAETAFMTDVLRRHSVQAVMHFAGFKAVGDSVAEPLKYYRNNLGSTLGLRQALPRGVDEPAKERLKAGQLSEVMDALYSFQEPDSTPTVDAPVRQCYGYIARRPGQFKYQEAMAANLPIGSGEVESAHRYVIQKRLKLPGAWWKKDNAQAMLNLRSARANHRWDHYWNDKAA